MSHITVIGGTGFAGSKIVAEAAGRGHEVVAFDQALPAERLPNVRYVEGDATDEVDLSAVVTGTEVVVAALSPRGPLAGPYRAVYRTIARLTDAAGARLFVVGGFSSLRPAAGAPRFVTDLGHAPAEVHDEILAGAAVIIEDLPATPETLSWVFVSPAGQFGAFAPGERLGRYRLGTDVSLSPEDGGAISGVDYALGFVDLIEQGTHHRAHASLAY